jgi:2'-5' RNA ligase
MRLYTVAFPALQPAADAAVDALRAAHDPQHRLLPAHFTLLFGLELPDALAYTAHVAAVAAATPAFGFVCRQALAVRDPLGGAMQLHLLPDEGASALHQLHRRLLAGPAAGARRPDIAYAPHITVATLADAAAAQALCAALGPPVLPLQGRIAQLHIGALQDGRFERLSAHPLAGATTA